MTITALDFLYLSLAIGFISLVILLNIILYNIIITIRAFKKSLDNVHQFTTFPLILKNKIKASALKTLRGILSKVSSKQK